MARILVVDDDLGNAEVLQLVLSSQHHVVKSITSSREIDVAISIFHPELIVMDILLDTGDGRLFCNGLKRKKHTKDIPVLLLTAMLESQANAIRSDADGLMFKPFDYDGLNAEVEKLLLRVRKYPEMDAQN